MFRMPDLAFSSCSVLTLMREPSTKHAVLQSYEGSCHKSNGSNRPDGGLTQNLQPSALIRPWLKVQGYRVSNSP